MEQTKQGASFISQEKPKPYPLTEEVKPILKEMWRLAEVMRSGTQLNTEETQYFMQHIGTVAAYYQQNSLYWLNELAEIEAYYLEVSQGDPDTKAKEREENEYYSQFDPL